MNLFDKNAPQNVQGWERAASVAGGLMLLGKGVRRGGVLGLLQLAVGGLALARGISGRCEAKRMLDEQKAQAASPEQPGLSGAQTPQLPEAPQQRYSHMPLDSEVHSPDFTDASVTLPDTTPMGHEEHLAPDRDGEKGKQDKPLQGKPEKEEKQVLGTQDKQGQSKPEKEEKQALGTQGKQSQDKLDKTTGRNGQNGAKA